MRTSASHHDPGGRWAIISCLARIQRVTIAMVMWNLLFYETNLGTCATSAST